MYFHSYIQSPRPDIPIPPSPHSQSAPSPTSLIMGTHDYRNNRDMHPFSPVDHRFRSHTHTFADKQIPPIRLTTTTLTLTVLVLAGEEVQVQAVHQQNNAPCPIPPFLQHPPLKARICPGRTITLNPVPLPSRLPTLPVLVLDDDGWWIMRQVENGKQVEEEGVWFGFTAYEATPEREKADDDADWVDEDEEVDQDDLLELKFHSPYVGTAEKRRRRWEIGWETLTQAFQNLDRQTNRHDRGSIRLFELWGDGWEFGAPIVHSWGVVVGFVPYCSYTSPYRPLG
ncbi:hypothetical protein M378DRAFT_13847 [Amanita muscaria Koide BX008]|uniref:Uncharacterized protein n=1 Tax=Amanita muscaria (strain Koide BX008) TaxID=946122 RepID=A0A0C2WVV4_AMAMK|nr:hypothetical protein M378DRAFT_13847 [Amanita muscaria Koide BX008]